MEEESFYDTLVLGGGGIKGICMLGVIQNLIDNDKYKYITNFVGTSAGSIICYFLSINIKPIEILTYLCTSIDLSKITYNISTFITGNGVASFDFIEDTIRDLTLLKKNRTYSIKEIYEEFGNKLYCTCTNLTTDKGEVIGVDNYPDMDAITAIKLSSSIPLFFPTVEYNNNLYTDGHFSMTYPVEFGIKITNNKILGICILNENNTIKVEDKNNMLKLVKYLLDRPYQKSIEEDIEKYKKVLDSIVLKYDEISTVDFNIDTLTKIKLFDYGYDISKNFFSN